MNRVVNINKGRLMIVNDLHGDINDYKQVKMIFLKLLEAGEADYLVFNGDVIHAYAGEDCSVEMLDDIIKMIKEHPGKIIYLLGNHEFVHVYGLALHKGGLEFTGHFKQDAGDKLLEYVNFFKSLAFAIRTKGGILICHNGAADIDYSPGMLDDFEHKEGLKEVLWEILMNKNEFQYGTERYKSYLNKALNVFNARFMITGHIPCEKGFEVVLGEQLRVNSGYGAGKSKKRYLIVDGEKSYIDINGLLSGVKHLYL